MDLKILSMRPFHAVAQGSPDATRELERHLHDIVSMYRKPKRVRGISNTDLKFRDDETWPHSTTYYRRMPQCPRLVRVPVLKMYVVFECENIVLCHTLTSNHSNTTNTGTLGDVEIRVDLESESVER